MVVIYTQEETFIRNNADDAKDTLSSVYGEKLSLEAYAAIKNNQDGISWRKNGGPLIQVVSEKKASEIRTLETAIGMIKCPEE